MLTAPAVVFLPKSVALRTAQHLDAVEVDEIECRRRRPAVVDLVDVETDSGIEPVVRLGDRDDAAAESADCERGVARIRRRVIDAGYQQCDLGDIVAESLIDRCGVDHRQRDRHGLCLLLSQAGRHDDRFERRGERRGLGDGSSRFLCGRHRLPANRRRHREQDDNREQGGAMRCELRGARGLGGGRVSRGYGAAGSLNGL